jgi:Tfp pilus assembly protein PilV
MTASSSAIARRRRAGFSLLEVLVACGILVIGLASIAAILPAAGSRLGEAAAQDRALAAAAAAMAEIQTRGLVSRGLVPTGTAGTFSPRATVFGETLSLAMTGSATSAGYVMASGSLTTTGTTVSLTTGGSATIQTLFSGTVPVLCEPVPAFINARINNDTSTDTRRGFFLEDEVQYLPSLTSDVPSNSFVSGIRQFNRGVCWGAMVTPVGASWPTATAAKLSVAVFRKPGNATALTLTGSGSGIFVTSASTVPMSLQRSILKPCSMVLAIPPGTTSGTVSPQWLSIRSSWILTGTMVINSGTFVGVTGTTAANIVSSGTGRTCVTFDSSIPSSLMTSGTLLNVIGFENLLLVNEQTLPVP